MAVATKQKNKRIATHHRKRQGTHQKRNGIFMKAYWPYLPMAFIVGLTIVFNSLMLQPNVLGYATNTSSAGLLASTNVQRTSNGLGALAINGKLTQAAQAKANDMVARNYWSHNTPDGQEPWVFFTNAGYDYLAAGENLAYGFATSEDTVTGWMNSPGHRANILNTAYQEVGFGIANSGNFQSSGEQTIVVAMYGKPAVAPAAAPAPAPTPAPTPAPAPTKKQTTQTTPTPTPTPTPAPAPTTTENITPTSEQPVDVEENAPTENNSDLAIGATVPESQKVSRIQLATSGAAPWSLFAASSFMVIMLLFLITRHSLAWHRAVVKGEKFFLKHKFLDIILVSAIMLTAIMSQTSGYIQ